MKANELRIGNFAQDQNGNLLVVSELTKEDIVFLVVDRSKFPLKDGWKAEFIELTEEWLIKFGFENTTSGYEKSILSIVKSTNDWSIWTSHETTQETFLVSIKYVHQLQNLYFALTGEELQIS